MDSSQAAEAGSSFVPLLVYNGTTATGGNSLTEDLNLFYQSGDIAWTLVCAVLVMLQIPGVGFFYSGLARRKNGLTLIWLSMVSFAVVSFQWFFWGYSFSFSHHNAHGSYGLWGGIDNFGMIGVLGAPSVGSAKVPDLVYCFYQLMFAALTVAILTGAAAERGRLLPCMVFIFAWVTLVYNPVAYWTWNPNGWAAHLGGLDFAGGTVVHILSGTGAFVYSWVLGPRRGHGTMELNYRPHNVVHIALGTVFLWAGWFGFNGGSALGANLRAAMACFVTNLAASVSGLAWCMLDYRLEGKWSMVGFCSGVVAGLVCITPGSGFVPPWAAVIFGLVSGIGCNYATKLKWLVGTDDALDIFAVHCIGGVLGVLLTALFAADYIAALDGWTVIKGGWLNHHWVQLGYQLAMATAAFVWCAIMTLLILQIIDHIPGLHLRASDAQELEGMDEAEIGEFAYDFVEVEREAKDVDKYELGLPTQGPNGMLANGSVSHDRDVDMLLSGNAVLDSQRIPYSENYDERGHQYTYSGTSTEYNAVNSPTANPSYVGSGLGYNAASSTNPVHSSAAP